MRGSRVVSDRSVIIGTERNQVTLHLTAPDQAGAALVWHTGSLRHVVALQQRADARGLHLQDARLTDREGRHVPCPSEDDLYDRLDLPFIAPELRAGEDEIGAAERNTLPALVLERHVRGDLHMHSTWSDGRDSVETMALAARQLGYEYIAITDHSERAFAVAQAVGRRNSTAAPGNRIAAPDGFRESTILHGVEVDIMVDGTPRFRRRRCSKASTSCWRRCTIDGGQDGPQLTERYLKAIQHPLVNVITHPANRSPRTSPGFDVDFDALFAAAAATGTAMEIDGAPGHLDMDGALARQRRRGRRDIDDRQRLPSRRVRSRDRCGSASGTARRGWIEPHHVLNTRSVDEVRAFVARKRVAVG